MVITWITPTFWVGFFTKRHLGGVGVELQLLGLGELAVEFPEAKEMRKICNRIV